MRRGNLSEESSNGNFVVGEEREGAPILYISALTCVGADTGDSPAHCPPSREWERDTEQEGEISLISPKTDFGGRCLVPPSLCSVVPYGGEVAGGGTGVSGGGLAAAPGEGGVLLLGGPVTVAAPSGPPPGVTSGSSGTTSTASTMNQLGTVYATKRRRRNGKT
ncbi:hypothetical protein J437_LFUL008507 [Ladona fulva]|uniref:Uncharacterized protein n=1 Tax=Ladona fulva TaxID=123851 RepID=A0A8K0K6V8_LADFU|nr:hypothetical protein J437_LFUL008507 [Ladona fulva]